MHVLSGLSPLRCLALQNWSQGYPHDFAMWFSDTGLAFSAVKQDHGRWFEVCLFTTPACQGTRKYLSEIYFFEDRIIDAGDSLPCEWEYPWNEKEKQHLCNSPGLPFLPCCIIFSLIPVFQTHWTDSRFLATYQGVHAVWNSPPDFILLVLIILL